MLRTLNHPNIVKYFGSEIHEDQSGVDIILEFVPGGSIKQLLDKFKSFDERLVKIYTRQMLEGLKYLHENNTIKLSDFGASKKIIQTFNDQGEEINSMSRSVIGSPYWMAPEVIMKSGHGKPADIWGIGCCVIEMLTSKPPWYEHGKDPYTVMNAIKSSKIPPIYPEGISQDCIDFLNYCFEYD